MKNIIPGAARLCRRPTVSWHTQFPMKCDESLVFVVAEVVSNQFKAMKKIFLSLTGVFVNIKTMVKILYSGVLDR